MKVAATYLNESFERLGKYCEDNGIEFSDLSIYIRMMLLYEEKYEDRYEYIMNKKINPVDDIVMIYVFCISHSLYGQEQTEDDSLIIEDKSFYVAFDDLKEFLSNYNMTVELDSFEDIKEMFLNKKTTVTRLTKTKVNKKNKKFLIN